MNKKYIYIYIYNIDIVGFLLQVYSVSTRYILQRSLPSIIAIHLVCIQNVMVCGALVQFDCESNVKASNYVYYRLRPNYHNNIIFTAIYTVLSLGVPDRLGARLALRR
jgi:hypothetical protein